MAIADLLEANYETDIDPTLDAPRIRFNFRNGWTGSLALRMMRPNGMDAMLASVAAWPTGNMSRDAIVFGPSEAFPDEAMSWLDDVRCWEPCA